VLLCRFQVSGIGVGLGDGQDRARCVAEHVLADGAQEPGDPVARRQDNELGVHCIGDADQGASGQVRDDPVFHLLGRVAERVADGLAEQVLGDGPVVDGAKTVLFCAWLAWSRFRVVLALHDRTMSSVVAALDTTFRSIGGASTYVLTDNEKTVTDRHIAGIAVRNAAMVAVSSYYGVTICTCVPYDPETKGGSESTVKIAKADLVPTEANLLDEYRSFAELDALAQSAAECVDDLGAQVAFDLVLDEAAIWEWVLRKDVEAPDLATPTDFFRFHAATRGKS